MSFTSKILTITPEVTNHPTVFHGATHCIVCGATYETCICSSEFLDDDNYTALSDWDLDTWDGVQFATEVNT